MKKVLVLGIAALALVGCTKTEEAAPATEAAPAVEAPATESVPEVAVEAKAAEAAPVESAK